MSEYAAEVLAALLLLMVIDELSGTRLFRRRRFYLLLALVSVGTLLFDGYLNARPVLQYGWHYLSGVQLWVVPVEDFGYGVALATAAIMTWELLERAGKRRH